MVKYDVNITIELSVEERDGYADVLVGKGHAIATVERLRTPHGTAPSFYWRVGGTEQLWPDKPAAVEYVGALLQNNLNTRGLVGI